MKMVACSVFLVVVCCSLMQQTGAMYYNNRAGAAYGGYGSDEGYSDEFNSPEVVGYRGYGATGYNSHRQGYGRDNDDDDDDDQSPCASTRFKRMLSGRKRKRPCMQGPHISPSHCSIDLTPYQNNNNNFFLPLILKEITFNTDYTIVLPDPLHKPRIPISPGSILTFSCPGGDLVDSSRTTISSGSGNAIAGTRLKCVPDNRVQGQHILVDSNQIQLDSIGCSNKLESVVANMPYARCGNGNGDLINIGFDSFGSFFYSQIEVCFNNQVKTTLWTRHTLHGGNLDASTPDDRTDPWKADALYGQTNIIRWKDDIYDTKKQLILLRKKLQRDVIKPAGPAGHEGLHFARGHLSPNADFVTTAEREGTFHYINALPQWQANNNGNWKSIVEASVQELAKSLATDLIIITGGHGILELKHLNNINNVPIYLKEATTTEPDQVPAPELMWKVVYNPATNKGVAFVTSNDPYIGKPESPTTKIGTARTQTTAPLTHLCTNVCGLLDGSWFKPNSNGVVTRNGAKRRQGASNVELDNYEKGYTYCCRVGDLMNIIPTIPTHHGNVALRTSGLLTDGALLGK